MSRHRPATFDGHAREGRSAATVLDEALNAVAVGAFAVYDLAARILDEPESSAAAERRLRRQSNALLLAFALHSFVRAAQAAISELTGTDDEHIVEAFARFDAAVPDARELGEVLGRSGGWPCRSDMPSACIGERSGRPVGDAALGYPHVFCRVVDGAPALHVGHLTIDVSVARVQAVALLQAVAEVCFGDEEPARAAVSAQPADPVTPSV